MNVNIDETDLSMNIPAGMTIKEIHEAMQDNEFMQELSN